jgi:hypothetical protein
VIVTDRIGGNGDASVSGAAGESEAVSGATGQIHEVSWRLDSRPLGSPKLAALHK